MGKNTRYDRLRDRLRQDYTRSRTYENGSLGAGETELIFDLSDPDNIGNDSHLEAGPFNYVSVRNTSDETIRVYLRNDLSIFVDIAPPSGVGGRRTVVTERIPLRYVGYLRIENDGDDPVDPGEVTLQVGNEVDSVEYSLLESSGLLDITTPSER